jgi:protein SCO1/2
MKGGTVRYRWIILLLVIILPLVGCGTVGSTGTTPTPAYAGQLRGAVFEPPRSLTDFSFPSTAGSQFRLSDHRGQVILIYFGYLTCPDFCPTTLAELQNIYRRLDQPADRLKVVFVSVDPERDTLAHMTSYIHAFHNDFIGLRGEGDALAQVMNQFGVVAEKQQLADSPLSYLIDHTASVFMIAPDGRLEAQYLYGTDYRDILHDVQSVLDAT